MIFSKNYKVYIFWGALSSLVYGQVGKPIALVSLGKNCEPAYKLRTFELRSLAYPFDWMDTFNFEGLCGVIENKFKDFLKKEYLKPFKGSILNAHYEVLFVHDFPTTINIQWQADEDAFFGGHVVENFLDYLEEVTKKYDKRIQRFFELLDGSTKIIFFRTHITPDEAKSFVAMMANNYPLADYLLVVVHRNPNFNFVWQIPHVQNFYAQKQSEREGGWFHRDEWKKIFIMLKLLSPNKVIKNEHEDPWLSYLLRDLSFD